MSFVKSVARSLIETSVESQKVVRHLSKMAKLNLVLKIEREKKKKLYKEIGEHVHNAKVQDVSDSAKIKTLRDRIGKQEQIISKLIEEINILKRINSCSYCGHVARENFKYCPRCSRPRKLG